jgi:diguanylate cyclase (GGDEF)-like protein/PAS domain S-box-containing protein
MHQDHWGPLSKGIRRGQEQRIVAERSAQHVGGVPLSVLLIESRAAQALLVTEALTSQHRVVWVDALHAAAAELIAGDYDCLIIELGLFDAEGLEVVEILRDAAADAALVVIASHPDEDAGLAAIRLGVDDFLPTEELTARALARSVEYAVERARLRNDLRRAEESARMLSSIVQSTGDAVFTKDLRGIVTSWNRGAEQLYGYTAEEMVGRHVSVLHPYGDESDPIIAVITEGRTIAALDAVRRTRSGRQVQVSLTISPMYSPRGTVTGASIIARDVTDRRELQTELEHQASHDALTGLANRALMERRLSEALARVVTESPDRSPELSTSADEDPTSEPMAGETQRAAPDHVAVLLVDLDRFGSINNAKGHQEGDRILVEVAARLRGAVRPADTVARLGGDEFVIVCRMTNTVAAQRVADRVAQELSRLPMHIGGAELQLTASIGIAVSPPLEPDAEALLRHADAAMYEAKATGRARSQVFDVSFARASRNRLELASDLREALRSDRLSIHYQPIVDVSSSKRVGAEALARWQHPDRGWIPPDVFVPLAEEMGLVEQLDTWVLSRACRDAAALRSTGHLSTEATMAVNLSARTVGEADLVDLVGDTLVEHGLPPEALTIEVTETALLNDPVLAGRSLQALREVGLGVALDDFGTGYSSLSFLREMPVTHLKIDRSFVQQIQRRPKDQAITAAMIDLARALDLHTVAEGIETSAQLSYLRQLGCTTGQGYLWSKPVPFDQLPAALLSGTVDSVPAQYGSPEDDERRLAGRRAGHDLERQGQEGGSPAP